MKEFYYSEGDNSYGPFTIEQLKEKGIGKDTLVWSEDMSEWKPAGEVAELVPLFTSPSTESVSYTSASKTLNNDRFPPKTYLLESILATIFCCLPFGIAGIVNAAKVDSRWDNGDFEGARRASIEAKKWTTWSFYAGLVVGIFSAIISVLSN